MQGMGWAQRKPSAHLLLCGLLPNRPQTSTGLHPRPLLSAVSKKHPYFELQNETSQLFKTYLILYHLILNTPHSHSKQTGYLTPTRALFQLRAFLHNIQPLPYISEPKSIGCFFSKSYIYRYKNSFFKEHYYSYINYLCCHVLSWHLYILSSRRRWFLPT